MSLKRIFDVAVSLIALIALAPLFIAVGLIIVITDFGPIFFRQQRVGRHGKVFFIHKFRTMRKSNSGPLVTSAADNRITPFGAFLRKWKIDELPQLFDVLRGAMSIVGPRPEVPRFVDFWPPESRDKILQFRPGISDPASIAFRDEQEILAGQEDPEQYYIDVVLPQKVKMYVEYVENQSFRGDMAIIMNTFRAIAS